MSLPLPGAIYYIVISRRSAGACVHWYSEGEACEHASALRKRIKKNSMAERDH